MSRLFNDFLSQHDSFMTRVVESLENISRLIKQKIGRTARRALKND